MVHILQILIVRLSRNSQLFSVEETVVDHEFDNTGRPPNVLNVLHNVFSGGFEVGEEGRAVRYPLKVVDGDVRVWFFGGAGHGDEVQDGVGGSSGDHDD